jgi:uncharacterized protein GlcG (DUF336 family)
MSLSEPKLSNPSTKFIEFKGDTGEFFYYDKATEQRVQLQMPIYFIVLDELSSIKGFNKQLKAGIYSNEVRYLKEEVLNVRTFTGGMKIVGKYQDIKDAALREGGKYCKSVYAALVTKDGVELVNFQMHGASFSGASDDKKCASGWINKKVNTEKYGIVVKETEQGKVGAVSFQAPVFEQGWLLTDKHDTYMKAVELDKELQKYLKTYLNNQVEKAEVGILESEVPNQVPIDELEPDNTEPYSEDFLWK